jgi:hypothetical protein
MNSGDVQARRHVPLVCPPYCRTNVMAVFVALLLSNLPSNALLAWQEPALQPAPPGRGATGGQIEAPQHTLGDANQAGEQSTIQYVPSQDSLAGNSVPVYGQGDYFAEDALAEGAAISPDETGFNFDPYAHGPEPYRIYRSAHTMATFLSAAPDEFGMTSLEIPVFSSRNAKADLTAGIGIHFLSGPAAIDLPPRVYDTALGYQIRESIGPFSFDAAASVGLYTDFEGSAREGVRFPSHATAMVQLGPAADFVFGVDYLHRDDIKILPVIGVSLHSPHFPIARFDLVFPRPRMEVLLMPGKRFYLSGELGGGTWDFRIPDGAEDVVSYRDYRILFGLEAEGRDGRWGGIELGYVFDRHLELRSGVAQSEFADSFVLRIISR